MIKVKLISRKPARWAVATGTKVGTVANNPNANRCQRWLLADGDTLKGFPSKRAAFCWFETGAKFTTNPVYPTIGGRKGTKRIA